MYLLNGLLLLNYVMLFEKLHLRAIKPSILLRKKKKFSASHTDWKEYQTCALTSCNGQRNIYLSILAWNFVYKCISSSLDQECNEKQCSGSFGDRAAKNGQLKHYLCFRPEAFPSPSPAATLSAASQQQSQAGLATGSGASSGTARTQRREASPLIVLVPGDPKGSLAWSRLAFGGRFFWMLSKCSRRVCKQIRM